MEASQIEPIDYLDWFDSQIDPADYPDWFTEGEYDAAIIYHSKNRKEACAFKELLTRLVNNEGEEQEEDHFPRLCMVEDFKFSTGKLQQLQMLINKSTFIFLYVTDNFLNDEYCQMQKDELIMSTIEDYDSRWKLIPVIPRRPRLRIPLGLKALNAISLSRLDYLGDIASSFKTLELCNICHYDRFFVANMQKLFTRKKHLRKQREGRNLINLRLWIRKTNGSQRPISITKEDSNAAL